jgi:hypothetical protein
MDDSLPTWTYTSITFRLRCASSVDTRSDTASRKTTTAPPRAVAVPFRRSDAAVRGSA